MYGLVGPAKGPFQRVKFESETRKFLHRTQEVPNALLMYVPQVVKHAAFVMAVGVPRVKRHDTIVPRRAYDLRLLLLGQKMHYFFSLERPDRSERDCLARLRFELDSHRLARDLGNDEFGVPLGIKSRYHCRAARRGTQAASPDQRLRRKSSTDSSTSRRIERSRPGPSVSPE